MKELSLLFNPAITLGCLSNLCHYLSSLLSSQWLPVVEGIPRPVSVPKGWILLSTQIQVDWKPDPRVAALKVYKHTSFRGGLGDRCLSVLPLQ